MPTKKPHRTLDAATIIAALDDLDRTDLDRVAATVDARRRGTWEKGNDVVLYVPYRHGVLQNEMRAYTRRDGTVRQRGPYWIFRFVRDGRQRSIYLGKVGDPKAALDEKLRKLTKGDR